MLWCWLFGRFIQHYLALVNLLTSTHNGYNTYMYSPTTSLLRRLMIMPLELLVLLNEMAGYLIAWIGILSA